ncbi:hypothetical protein G6F65_021834 [Rhizopus arrhizus]|nr:hypothetical protein G6F24_017663 [Rhizopus arrhizus]KAG1244387.1 hypothetical protein G6F65_021834 [Rhizopus arrhizus]
MESGRCTSVSAVRSIAPSWPTSRAGASASGACTPPGAAGRFITPAIWVGGWRRCAGAAMHHCSACCRPTPPCCSRARQGRSHLRSAWTAVAGRSRRCASIAMMAQAGPAAIPASTATCRTRPPTAAI